MNHPGERSFDFKIGDTPTANLRLRAEYLQNPDVIRVGDSWEPAQPEGMWIIELAPLVHGDQWPIFMHAAYSRLSAESAGTAVFRYEPRGVRYKNELLLCAAAGLTLRLAATAAANVLPTTPMTITPPRINTSSWEDCEDTQIVDFDRLPGASYQHGLGYRVPLGSLTYLATEVELPKAFTLRAGDGL